MTQVIRYPDIADWLPLASGPSHAHARHEEGPGVDFYTSERQSRAASIKVTRRSSSVHSLPPETQRRLSLEKSQDKHKAAHHRLPSPAADGQIPPDPILYLPPLLSPLPARVQPPSSSTSGGLLPGSRAAVELIDKELLNFETRLPDIDPASLELHQALHGFKPVDGDYASRPYDKAFNWADLRLPLHTARDWYCVVFRSRRNAESSSLSLYQADREAHEEAVMNGGLVMYWYGVPDSTGLNLATCIWQSRRHAIKAISGPKHVLAMQQAKNAYEVYDLERWVLSKWAGEDKLRLRRWEGGDVGW